MTALIVEMGISKRNVGALWCVGRLKDGTAGSVAQK